MTFDDALSNCLDLIDLDVSIEMCLRQFPDYAVDLEPMLEVVIALRAQSRPRMSSAGFQQGRTAMAVKLRSAQRPQSWLVVPSQIGPIVVFPSTDPTAVPVGQELTPTPYNRPRRALPAPYTYLHAMTTAIAAVVLLLSVYSLARSVNTSLPGEPLYTAKRSVEDFQGTLMMVMGESASWHAQQTKRRLRESIALQDQNRPVDADFALDIRAHVWMSINAASILPLSERQAFLNQWLSDLQQMQASYDQTAYLAVGVTGSASTGNAPGKEDPLAETMQQSIRTVENAAGTNPVPAVMPTVTPTLTATPEPPTPTSTMTPTATPSNTPTATKLPTMPPAPTNTVAVVVPPTVAPTLPPTVTPMPTNTRDSSDDSNSDKKTSTPIPPTSTLSPPTSTPAPTSTNTPESSDATPTVEPTDEGTPGASSTPDPNDTPTAEPTDDGTPGPDDTPDPNGTATAEPTRGEGTPEPDNTPESTSELTPGVTATVETGSTPVPPETSESPGKPTDDPQVPNPVQPATPNAPAPPETDP